MWVDVDELLKKQTAAYLVENPFEMVVRASDIKEVFDALPESEKARQRREWHYDFWE